MEDDYDNSEECYELYVSLLKHWDPDFVDRGNFTLLELQALVFSSLKKPFRKAKSNNAFHHYALTLTMTTPDQEVLQARLHKIKTSKLISPVIFEYCIEHPDDNVHAHVYLKTDRYIYARDILRMNDKDRVDVKKLKGLDIAKWQNYMRKDTEVVSL